MKARLRYSLLLVLLIGACKQKPAYSFYDDFVAYSAGYQASSEEGAKVALLVFLNNAASNSVSARQDHRLSYTPVMAQAWLRLAGILRDQHDVEGFQRAMTSAIGHFDQIPSFRSP